MFKKFFNGQAKSITSAAIIIGAASLISRLLGFLRDRVLAGEFGAGEFLDTYYAAFRIPDLVFHLLVLGTLSAGFIPVFTKLLHQKELFIIPGFENQKKAWLLVNNLFHALVFGLIIIFIILFIFAPALMKLVAPGFTPEQMSVTVTLTRIMFLSPIFLGMSGIIGGVLQSFKRFFVYSLAPIFYNIGIIVGALFLVPFFGIYGLAWGVVLGALAHLLVQIPTFFHLGFRYQPFLNFKDTNIRKIFVMMVPRTLSLAVSQINFLVVTVIGSALAAGSITVFTFANNIQSLPLGIFGISFAIAAFPTLSEQTNHPKKFVESFRTTLNQILFFIIPTSVLFIILRAQIIRVVLGSGNFNWEDTILTMDALALFSLSLFAQSLIPLFARAFFAFHDSRSPFIVGFISVLINIGLSLVLAPKMGVLGLALSFSVSATVQLIFLWFWLHKKLHTLSELKMLVPFLKVLFASLFLAMATQGTKHVIEPLFGTDTFFGIFIQGFTAGFVGILIYVVICVALRVEEAIIFITSLQKKLFKKFKPFEISDIVE